MAYAARRREQHVYALGLLRGHVACDRPAHFPPMKLKRFVPLGVGT
jgi:hypothetical protein